DWSSDVCSSDLFEVQAARRTDLSRPTSHRGGCDGGPGDPARDERRREAPILGRRDNWAGPESSETIRRTRSEERDEMVRTAWRHAERDRNERAPTRGWAVTD